ncbi:hypothetical protein K4K56_006683 [Colletotrichum sp. SAR 10_98]|nr:hypothetical protein K4K56_006683 [Colletotrichum sp. SAR 10_98]
MIDKVCNVRIEKFFNKRNFGKILSSSIAELTLLELKRAGAKETAAGEDKGSESSTATESDKQRLQRYDNAAVTAAKDALKQRVFYKGGRDVPTALLDDRLRKGLTKTQAAVLRDVYKQLSLWRSQEIGDVDPDIDLDWRNSCLTTHGQSDETFYSPDGRQEFQVLFSNVLRSIKSLSKKVAEDRVQLNQTAKSHKIAVDKKESVGKNLRGRQPLPDPELEFGPKREARISTLTSRIRDLQGACLCFVYLRRHFADVVEAQCLWLEQIHEPTSTHLPGCGNYPPKGTDAEGKPKQSRDSILSEPGSGRKPFYQHASGTNTPASAPASQKRTKSGTDPSSADRDKGKSSSSKHGQSGDDGKDDGKRDAKGDDNDEDEDDAFDVVASDHGWHVAASDGLGLVCRNQESVEGLLNTESKLAELFLKADVEPVVASMAKLDKFTLPTHEFIENYQPENVKLTDDEVETLSNWFAVQMGGSGSSESFSGAAAHAKALLFVMLLVQYRREKMIGDPTEETSGLTLPSLDLLERFKKLSAPMAVNKRCCPVCFILMKHVEKVTGIKFVYAGTHSDWSSVSLPPFMPKEDFDAVFSECLKVFMARYHTYVEEHRMGRSTQDGGTRSAPTRTPTSQVDNPTLRLRHVWSSRKEGGVAADVGDFSDPEDSREGPDEKSTGSISPSDRRKETLDKKKKKKKQQKVNPFWSHDRPPVFSSKVNDWVSDLERDPPADTTAAAPATASPGSGVWDPSRPASLLFSTPSQGSASNTQTPAHTDQTRKSHVRNSSSRNPANWRSASFPDQTSGLN